METEVSTSRALVVFADYVCPFSYLSLLAVERLAGEVAVAIDWRALELRPAPLPPLAAPSDEEWAVVSDVAQAAGAWLARPVRQPRTRKAHEATKFAATVGMEAQLRHALFDAHFAAARDIGRIDALVEIASEIGIDALALKVALDVDTFTDDIAADLELARRLEIEGTPAFIAGSDVRVGYLSYDHLRDWLED